MKQELTPLERNRLYFAGERVDRLPCGLLGIETGCSLYGISPADCLHSVELAVQVQNKLIHDFDADSIGYGPDLKGIGEALGTKIVYPKWNICYVDDPVLKDYHDLDRLRETDVRKAGRLPYILEFFKNMKEQHGDTHGIDNAVAGPLSTAAAIRGTENLLKDMRKNEENLHRLLEFAVEVNLKWIKYVWDTCEITVSVADPVASGSLLGRDRFCEFGKPYLQKMCREIRQITKQKPSLHICGKTSSIWKELRDIEISGFALDNCESLEKFKEAVGDVMTISGNINPTDVMRFGNPEMVTEALLQCLTEGSDSPCGYIPGAGCQIPLGTPKENLLALTEGVKQYTKGAKMGKRIRMSFDQR